MARFKYGILLFIAIIFVFAGCGTNDKYSNKLTDESRDETTTDEETTTEKVTEPETRPEALKTSIAVEAGTTIINVSDFVKPYMGESVTIEKNVTEEELRVAGVTYEMKVKYQGTEYIVNVEVVDNTAPVISGVKDITIYVGDNVAFKRDVSVSDNSDEEIELLVNNSNVNTGVAGSYNVIYSATDSSGNMATETAILYVIERPVINEEYVAPIADNIINNIITDDMSQWDKAYILWNWCRNNISYTHSSGDRSSVWTGAYEGLHNRSGDCFTFYATYSVLLTRCGIENLQVTRIGGNSNHWWNLVNVGDGWYHCDTSPRVKGDKYKCFMQTDEQVEAYTIKYSQEHPEHPNYFTFDKSLYPERATDIVFGE